MEVYLFPYQPYIPYKLYMSMETAYTQPYQLNPSLSFTLNEFC